MFKNDIVLRGRHAFYLKNFSSTNKATPNLYPFDRYIDTLLAAAAIGLEGNLKGEVDRGSEYKDEKATIFKSAIDSEYANIEFLIYTLALKNSSNDNNELINLFNEDKKTLLNKYEKYFFGYVYGGLEKLIEIFGEIEESDRNLKRNLDEQVKLIKLINEERHDRDPDYSLDNITKYQY